MGDTATASPRANRSVIRQLLQNGGRSAPRPHRILSHIPFTPDGEECMPTRLNWRRWPALRRSLTSRPLWQQQRPSGSGRGRTSPPGRQNGGSGRHGNSCLRCGIRVGRDGPDRKPPLSPPFRLVHRFVRQPDRLIHGGHAADDHDPETERVLPLTLPERLVQGRVDPPGDLLGIMGRDGPATPRRTRLPPRARPGRSCVTVR